VSEDYSDNPAFRVIPLAERVLKLLLEEDNMKVRRAALKCVKVAADHWTEATHDTAS
jgi:hypothetical protein